MLACALVDARSSQEGPLDSRCSIGADFVSRRKLDFVTAAKLDFVTREKRDFVVRRKLILWVDVSPQEVAFSRKMVDVRGEDVDFRPKDNRVMGFVRNWWFWAARRLGKLNFLASLNNYALGRRPAYTRLLHER